MSLGIGRHAGGFTQVDVGWKLQRLGGIERDFRNGLSDCRDTGNERSSEE